MAVVAVVVTRDVVPVTVLVGVAVAVTVRAAVGIAAVLAMVVAGVIVTVGLILPSVVVVAAGMRFGLCGAGGDGEHGAGEAGENPIRAHDVFLWSEWGGAIGYAVDRLQGGRHGGLWMG